MPWISFTTASYARSCLYLYLAFQFWKDSSVITEQPLFVVFGQAMHMDHGAINQHNKDVTGMFSLFFASLGAVDFVQLSVGNTLYFESIIPVRLLLAFIFAGVAYLKRDSVLHDDFVFSFNFLEIWLNFLTYNVLRQDKFERRKKLEELVEAEMEEAQHDEEKFQELMAKIQQLQ